MALLVHDLLCGGYTACGDDPLERMSSTLPHDSPSPLPPMWRIHVRARVDVIEGERERQVNHSDPVLELGDLVLKVLVLVVVG